MWNVNKKIRKPKEYRLNAKCEEIEYLDKEYGSFNLHSKVKKVAGTHQHRKLILEKPEIVKESLTDLH